MLKYLDSNPRFPTYSWGPPVPQFPQMGKWGIPISPHRVALMLPRSVTQLSGQPRKHPIHVGFCIIIKRVVKTVTLKKTVS